MLLRPSSLDPSVMTTRGQIRNRFSVFGGISLIVVEFHGLANERLAAIAQVIAECDACDYTNDQLDLPPRIFGILSDGSSFEFFVFNGSAKPAIFSRGIFHTTPGSKPYENSSSKITMPYQMLPSFEACGLFARPSSTFSSWLIKQEWTDIQNDLPRMESRIVRVI